MIGRKDEIKIMHSLLASAEADLLAIVGRRRIGKTYLVEEVYKEYIVFEYTGTQNASLENQLEKFADKLTQFNKNKIEIKTPKSWANGFEQLKHYLKSLRKSFKKKVIFFDEVQWISAHRSGFLEEFSYWWNDWASKQNLLVVICGSVASWMIDKVINNKGGLHNRVTRQIHINPFTLAETRSFLQSRSIHLDHYQLIQLYMSIGGIPHYLKEIQKGETAAQAINRICFQSKGTLRHEFDNLYKALFDQYENHISVVRSISTKHYGMNRAEIGRITKLGVGGGLTRIINELTAANFILGIHPLGKKKKNILYRLTDEYSLFYLKFIEGHSAGNQHIWIQQSSDQKYKIWQGYAYENICIKHVEAIKKSLGISGMHSTTHSYFAKKTKLHPGLQIDFLIDRADRAINICESKFYDAELTFSEKDAESFRKKRTAFKELTATKKAIFNTIITTYGINKNNYSMSQVDQIVTMDALFELDHF